MMVADACTIFPPASLQRHEQLRRVRISDRQSRGRDDDLIECCYCEIRGFNSGVVVSQVCWDVSFVDWYVDADVSNDRAFETSITFPVDTAM
jgi:hypothetical protein